MAKLTQKAAKDLLEGGFITQEQYDKMFSDGVVTATARASREQVNVPVEKKAEFLDKAYDALIKVAKSLDIDHTKPTPESGVATIYLKGAGKPKEKSEE